MEVLFRPLALVRDPHFRVAILAGASIINASELFSENTMLLIVPPSLTSDRMANIKEVNGVSFILPAVSQASWGEILIHEGRPLKGSLSSAARYPLVLWWRNERIGAMAQEIVRNEADDLAATSFHRHLNQRETWIVTEGEGSLITLDDRSAPCWEVKHLYPGVVASVDQGVYHQIVTANMIRTFLVMENLEELPPHDHFYREAPSREVLYGLGVIG